MRQRLRKQANQGLHGLKGKSYQCTEESIHYVSLDETTSDACSFAEDIPVIPSAFENTSVQPCSEEGTSVYSCTEESIPNYLAFSDSKSDLSGLTNTSEDTSSLMQYDDQLIPSTSSEPEVGLKTNQKADIHDQGLLSATQDQQMEASAQITELAADDVAQNPVVSTEPLIHKSRQPMKRDLLDDMSLLVSLMSELSIS